MFRRSIEIITSSFKMALQELWKNKLRTELVTAGQVVRSYDPETGAVLWERRDLVRSGPIASSGLAQ